MGHNSGVSVEPLEGRVLRAVDLSLTDNGKLKIIAPAGDTEGDVIELALINDNHAIQVWVNGILRDPTPKGGAPDSVKKSKVDRIVADLGGGDDTIVIGRRLTDPRVFKNKLQVPCTLVGGDGNDFIESGPQRDRLIGGAGNDTIFGARGDDVIYCGSGDDQAFGETGRDVLYGQDGNDYLDGDGNDFIEAGPQKDRIIGGAGNDTIFAGKGDDVVYCGSGDDQAFGETGRDNLYGQDGNDHLDGDGNQDALYGMAGADNCIGGEDKDFVNPGNDPNDTLDRNDLPTEGQTHDVDAFVAKLIKLDVPDKYRDDATA